MELCIGFIIALLLLSSCGKDPALIDPIMAPCESDAVEIAYKEKQAEAVQDFGVRIFQESVKAESDKNTVLSPISIYSALLLAYEASACDTKKQIMSTLGIGEGNLNVDASIEYLDFMSSILPSESDVTFSYANAFFSDPNRIQTHDFYVSKLEQYYNAEVASLDFAQSSAVDAVNTWAEENTNGKIKEVLQEISGDEIAFLLNAIYYSGEWLSGFNEQNTMDRPFQLEDDAIINVPTMTRDAVSNVFEDDNYKMVDMDIKGGEYAVSFLTPSDQTHIDDFLLRDNFLDDYQQLLTQLQSERIMLSIPKFELEGKQQLKELLITLGMTDAFNQGSANFSGMGTAGGNIFLTRVIHDTYIKVDEKGIEGAAVTTIGVGANSVPLVVEFNKPFVFLLRHKETGVPIFMGKVENPVK